MRPGPLFIALSTILASTCLTFFLLSISAGFNYPQAIVQTSAALTVTSQGSGGEKEVASTNQENSSTKGAFQVTCAVSERFPSSILQWCDLITQYAEKHGLPPDLIAALVWQESGGNPEAYSRSGAVGLMQIMPRDGLAASFMCQNGPCFSNRPSTDELKDPEFNVKYGTRMLASLVSRKGNFREALKSYGPMNVGYYYADKVLGIYERYRN
jgi:hypothetical protein